MDDRDMEGMLEKASLLPERWYLIFRQGDSDDHVMMTSYDRLNLARVKDKSFKK